MNKSKDLKRFQPDSGFSVRLENHLKKTGKGKSYYLGSVLPLAASFALFIWLSPQKIEKKIIPTEKNQELEFLQEHFEATDENLELLSTTVVIDKEVELQEDELIDELKMMY